MDRQLFQMTWREDNRFNNQISHRFCAECTKMQKNKGSKLRREKKRDAISSPIRLRPIRRSDIDFAQSNGTHSELQRGGINVE